MKTIIKYSLPLCGFVLIACQKVNNEPDMPNPSDATITIGDDGMIQSPKWLVDIVNSVVDQYSPSPVTGEKVCYPWVYSVEYNEQNYIHVWDGLNSCWVCANMYFTLSGDAISAETPDLTSGLYGELENAKHRGNKVLLWMYGYEIINGIPVKTRAESEIQYFTPNGSLVPDTWVRDEHLITPYDISYARNYYKLAYPNAKEISGPSTTYNWVQDNFRGFNLKFRNKDKYKFLFR